jgi:thymidylate synthase (FAD)
MWQENIPDFKDNYSFPTSIDDLAEQAGRLCYLSWDRPNPATAYNKEYLANIIAQSHFSVLEHASASFYIDGVTRNFTHELIRHRHLSFSEVSQRYVDVGEFPFVHHPGLQGIEVRTKDVRDLYRTLMELLTLRGLKRKEARQAARHVLPGGLETKILVTGNMRAWREVLQKRLSPTADAEFQLVAKEILGILKNIAPNTFQDFE